MAEILKLVLCRARLPAVQVDRHDTVRYIHAGIPTCPATCRYENARINIHWTWLTITVSESICTLPSRPTSSSNRLCYKLSSAEFLEYKYDTFIQSSVAKRIGRRGTARASLMNPNPFTTDMTKEPSWELTGRRYLHDTGDKLGHRLTGDMTFQGL